MKKLFWGDIISCILIFNILWLLYFILYGIIFIYTDFSITRNWGAGTPWIVDEDIHLQVIMFASLAYITYALYNEAKRLTPLAMVVLITAAIYNPFVPIKEEYMDTELFVATLFLLIAVLIMRTRQLYKNKIIAPNREHKGSKS